MIRIDEIYYNVFGSAVRSRSGVSLHWFDPFGSKNFADLVAHAQHSKTNHYVIFWDQEPFYKEDAQKFLDQFFEKHCAARRKENQALVTLVTSEMDSKDIEWALNTYKITDLRYYFYHEWAALDWYRDYNHSYLLTPWTQRSFDHMIFLPKQHAGNH